MTAVFKLVALCHSDDVGLQDQQNVSNKPDQILVEEFICNVFPEERSFELNSLCLVNIAPLGLALFRYNLCYFDKCVE